MHEPCLRFVHFIPRQEPVKQTTVICGSHRRPIESQNQEVEEKMALKVGEDAPDFCVTAVVGVQKVKVSLSDYRGKKNVVIAFYPLDWTPV
jgi:peroxiredoxin